MPFFLIFIYAALFLCNQFSFSSSWSSQILPDFQSSNPVVVVVVVLKFLFCTCTFSILNQHDYIIGLAPA